VFAYFVFMHGQGDVFLEPQIHAGINRFQIDMVPNVSYAIPCRTKWIVWTTATLLIQKLASISSCFLAVEVPYLGEAP